MWGMVAATGPVDLAGGLVTVHWERNVLVATLCCFYNEGIGHCTVTYRFSTGTDV
ncbi:MAG: hypothetical protein NVSMB22_23870 [Chloroflexota bacterium]